MPAAPRCIRPAFYNDFIHPLTGVAYQAHDILDTISPYDSAGITEVVVKRDRKNGSIGIHRFHSIEDVYNHASLATLVYPLVIQPFIEHFRDIRAIVPSENIEAYERGKSSQTSQLPALQRLSSTI